jgi:hypothetical protein
MTTYTLTMASGQTYTLSPVVTSPLVSEDLSRAVADTLGPGYWIDRITPISWRVRDKVFNRFHGTIVRDLATYYPTVFGDWECVAKITGDTLTLTFLMLPGRGYWEAPSATELRNMAREVARQFGRELAYRTPADRYNMSRGFHARYVLATN